jgi:hypothetical protein
MKRFNAGYSSLMHFERARQSWLLILLSVLAFACSTALYIPGESMHISGEELASMQKGRALYISKCGSCHTLVLPEKYNARDWQNEVAKMAPKVHLTRQEEEDILRYITKNDSSLFPLSKGNGTKK